ncbi:MAG: hypothetical protein QXE05_10345 [Nitrososphaeria archaeon]
MRVINLKIFIYCLMFIIFSSVCFAFFSFSVPFFNGKLIICFAYIFVIPYALWFGLFGCLSVYLGFFLGAVLININDILLNSLLSLHAFFLAFIPFLAFKYFNVDMKLTSLKGQLVFVVFGLFIGNLVSTTWGSVIPALLNFWSWSIVLNTWVSWTAGNLILLGIFTPLILHYLTEYMS